MSADRARTQHHDLLLVGVAGGVFEVDFGLEGDGLVRAVFIGAFFGDEGAIHVDPRAEVDGF